MAVIDIDFSLLDSERVMARCDELATLSSMSEGICRTYLTAEHKRCNSLVHSWMNEAGMATWEDAAGNCWGRLASDFIDSPTIIIGSHLDTVPNAGKYDGILGVVAAIEVAAFLNQQDIALPFHIDIVGFGDEEGVRFGATLLGSRAVAGTWEKKWFDLVDKDGTTLRQAMIEFGINPEEIKSADRSGEHLLGYYELHIEQGPVLEQVNQPLGVVSSIAGARRFIFNYEGMAGHAGTVPMELRQDALVAAALSVKEIEAIASSLSVVATVGRIEAFPGSVNVIPGHCEMTLDIRSGQDTSRDLALERILKEIEQICKIRNVTFSKKEVHNASAIKCASQYQRQLETVLQDMSLEPVSLVSGAGHDAMAFGGVTDMSMLFVRCKGGISHHPAESVTAPDVMQSLEATCRWVLAQI